MQINTMGNKQEGLGNKQEGLDILVQVQNYDDIEIIGDGVE